MWLDLIALSKPGAAKPALPIWFESFQNEPVAAKYRNKATGETWSGRGLQPKWLKAALAAGRKIDDFAV